MNMIEFLANRSNVTGAERDILKAISSFALEKNLDVSYDSIGNLVVRIYGKASGKKNVMLSCGVDVPGYICLSNINGKAYLAQTKSSDPKKLQGKSVTSESHRRYKIKLDASDNLFVSSRSLTVGDTLKDTSKYSEDSVSFVGEYVGKYAIVSTLIRLLSYEYQNDVTLVFTVQSEGPCPASANAAEKYRPDACILIGRTESKENVPMSVIRDGKQFSDPKLLKLAFSLSAKKLVTDPKYPINFDAEFVGSTVGIPVLSLALPCKNCNEPNESVFKTSYEKLHQLITSLCNSTI